MRITVDGTELVVPKAVGFPKNCMVCGEAADGVIDWRGLKAPYCAVHLRAHRWGQGVLVGAPSLGLLWCLGVVGVLGTAGVLSSVLVAVGLLGGFGGAAWALWGMGMPRPVGISGDDGQRLWIGGVGKPLLDKVVAANATAAAEEARAAALREVPSDMQVLGELHVTGAIAVGARADALQQGLPAVPGVWKVLLNGDVGEGLTYLVHPSVAAAVYRLPADHVVTVSGVRGRVLFVDDAHRGDASTLEELRHGEDAPHGIGAQMGGNGSVDVDGAFDASQRLIMLVFEH